MNIFQSFLEYSWSDKKVYVDVFVTSIPIKRPRGRKEEKDSKRRQSLIYHLKKQDQLLKGSRTMFLNTLVIVRWTVLKWKNKQINI